MPIDCSASAISPIVTCSPDETTDEQKQILQAFIDDTYDKFVEVVEAARAREVPVLVDMASDLPPVTNLSRFLDDGADLHGSGQYRGARTCGDGDSLALIAGLIAF